MKNVLLVGTKYDTAAAEFCKTLMTQGYKTVILTSSAVNICAKNNFSNKAYIKAINSNNIKKIIIDEKIDTIFLNFGNKESMKTVLDLSVSGFLDENKVMISGLNVNTLYNILSPEHFNIFLDSNDLHPIENRYSSTLDYALQFAEEIGYPVYVYPAFTIGTPNKTLCYNEFAVSDTFNSQKEKSNLKQVFVEKSIDKFQSYKLCFLTDVEGKSRCILAGRHLEPYGIGHKNSPIFIEDINPKLKDKMTQLADKILEKSEIVGFSTLYFAYNEKTQEILSTYIDPLFSKLYRLAKIYTGLDLEKINLKLLNGETLENLDLKFNQTKKLTAVSNAYFIDDAGFNTSFDNSYYESFIKNLSLLSKEKINKKILNVCETQTQDLLISLDENNKSRFFALGELILRGKDVENLSLYTGIAENDLNFIAKIYSSLKNKELKEFNQQELNSDEQTVLFVNGYDSSYNKSNEKTYLSFFTALKYKENGYKTISLTSNFDSPAACLIAFDKVIIDKFDKSYIENLKVKLNAKKVIFDFNVQEQTETDVIEDKINFAKLLKTLDIKHRPYSLVHDKENLLTEAQTIGYPISVKNNDFDIVFWNKDELIDFIDSNINFDRVLVEKYFTGICTEVFCVKQQDEFKFINAVEKIERAGVNATDSIAVMPYLNLPEKAISNIKEISKKLLNHCEENKIMNIEYVYYNNEIYLLNRSDTKVDLLPFVNTLLVTDIGEIYYNILENKNIDEVSETINKNAVLMPMFDFDVINEKNNLLLSKSVGKVVSVEDSFAKAFIEAMRACKLTVKDYGSVFFSLKDSEKQAGVDVAYKFYKLGFKVFATGKTAKTFNENFIPTNLINRMSDEDDHLIQMINKNKLDYLVILTDSSSSSYKDTVYLRRIAEEKGIPTFTSLVMADTFIDSLSTGEISEN